MTCLRVGYKAKKRMANNKYPNDTNPVVDSKWSVCIHPLVEDESSKDLVVDDVGNRETSNRMERKMEFKLSVPP
jgi:hypothetical protein